MVARILVGEDDSVGVMNLLEGLLCGEYSRKRGTLLRLMITPLGIPLISYVGEFDELRWRDRKSFAEDDLSVAIS